MKDLIYMIVKELVTNPEEIKIEEDTSAQDGLIVYRLRVAEEDMGRIIGKQGRIAKSIRQIVRSAGLKKGTRVAIEIG